MSCCWFSQSKALINLERPKNLLVGTISEKIRSSSLEEMSLQFRSVLYPSPDTQAPQLAEHDGLIFTHIWQDSCCLYNKRFDQTAPYITILYTYFIFRCWWGHYFCLGLRVGHFFTEGLRMQRGGECCYLWGMRASKSERERENPWPMKRAWYNSVSIISCSVPKLCSIITKFCPKLEGAVQVCRSVTLNSGLQHAKLT